MRLFIAVPVPGGFLERAGNVQEFLKRSKADVKWVSPGNMHLTLHFLGETHEDRLDDLKSVLAGISNVFEFSISPGNTGAFPSCAAPRVLWIGISRGGEDLTKMAGIIGSALAQKGFPVEERPFTPHLTLGRVRSRKGIGHLVNMLKSIPFADPPPCFAVNSVELIESTLGPHGPAYKTLQKTGLRVLSGL